MPGKEETEKAKGTTSKKGGADASETTENKIQSAQTEGTKGTDAGSPNVAAPDPLNGAVDQKQIQEIDEALGAKIQDEQNPPAKNASKEDIAAEKSGITNGEAIPEGVKQVTITMVEDRETTIGGVTYDLKKHKTYDVPEDVAAILTNAFIAMRK